MPDRAPTVDGPSRVQGGFAILRSDQVLAPLLAGVALVVLLVGMVDVVLVYLVRETLHAGGVWYGVAEGAACAANVLPPWDGRPVPVSEAPALLAALTTAAIPGRPPAGTPAGTTPDSIQLSTWEWEGGQDGRQIAAGGHIRRELAAAPGS